MDMVGAAAAVPHQAVPAAAAVRPNAIDDLLGLETELSAIQAGIQQIDKIAPNPPMSFQTDSMMPLSLSSSGPQSASPAPNMAAQQPPQPPTQAPRRPVAVMNQNPPVSEVGTAPFLPPPPSKPGRKPEQSVGQGQDRYAVFDSVQRYAHNNNILQQQQQPQQQPAAGAFGNAFMDDGIEDLTYNHN